MSPQPTNSAERLLTWEGVRTVAGLELRQRVRTSRWVIVLSVWAVVIYGVGLLSWLATGGMTEPDAFDEPASAATRSVVLYGITVFLVLGLSLLVTPSLTASSVNGDRDHGVLATLQTTLLSPQEIILGKLLASWAVAGVFLAVGLPMLAFSLFAGGVGVGTLVLAVICLAVVLAAVCAIGLLLSTLTARPVTSVVLTYLTVGFCSVGTLILMGVLAPLTVEDRDVEVRIVYGFHEDGRLAPNEECVWRHETRPQHRTDRLWGLLAANPFVVVADAAPGRSLGNRAFEPLSSISAAARGLRAGPQDRIDECWTEEQSSRNQPPDAGPVWPWGLGLYTLAGVGATWLAIRRVRTPMRTLGKGVRIA